VKLSVPLFLAVSCTGGFFTLVFLMMFVPVPEPSKELLYVLTGQISTAWVAIVMYHYGSSSGSSQHSETIAKALEVRQNEAATTAATAATTAATAATVAATVASEQIKQDRDKDQIKP